MTDMWRAEARKIEPWLGAKGISAEGPSVRAAVEGWNADGKWLVSVWQGFLAVSAVLDLEDGDTLAAFDRRLALRRGATEAETREGVVFFPIHGDDGVTVWVMQTRSGKVLLGASTLNTNDPLLARVRAWLSVTP